MKFAIEKYRAHSFFSIGLLVIICLLLIHAFVKQSWIIYPLTADHPFGWNVFFINVTFMGNGFFILPFALLLKYKWKMAATGNLLIYAMLIVFAFVLCIKHVIYFQQPFLLQEAAQLIFREHLNERETLFITDSYVALSVAASWVILLQNNLRKFEAIALSFIILIIASRCYLAGIGTLEINSGIAIGYLSGLIAYSIWQWQLKITSKTVTQIRQDPSMVYP